MTLLSAAASAMQDALTALAAGRSPDALLGFEALREIVGFPAYDEEAARYRTPAPDEGSDEPSD